MKRNKKIIRIVSALSAFLILSLSCFVVTAFASDGDDVFEPGDLLVSDLYAYVRSDDWQETFSPEFFDGSLVDEVYTHKLIHSEEKGTYLKVWLNLKEPSLDNLKALESSLLKNERVIGFEELHYVTAVYSLITDNHFKISTRTTVFDLKKANEEYGAKIIRDRKELENSDSLATGDMYYKTDSTMYYVVVTGDVDGNGRISSADARAILRRAAKLEIIDKVSSWAADVDGNGKINSSDARCLLRTAARLDNIDSE